MSAHVPVVSQSHCDFMEATSYAWGRSDAGENLKTEDVYRFGEAWASICNDFREGITNHKPSLVGFFEETFHGLKEDE